MDTWIKAGGGELSLKQHSQQWECPPALQILGISISTILPLMCILWNFVWSSSGAVWPVLPSGIPDCWDFPPHPTPEAFHSRLWALIPCRNIPRAGSISLASLGSWLWIPHPSWNQWKTHLNSLFPQNHRHAIPPNSQIRVFQQQEDPERLGSLSSFFLV